MRPSLRGRNRMATVLEFPELLTLVPSGPYCDRSRTLDTLCGFRPPCGPGGAGDGWRRHRDSCRRHGRTFCAQYYAGAAGGEIVAEVHPAPAGLPSDDRNPDQFIPEFADAGADWISVHQVECKHLNRTLHLIKSHKCRAGVVINPATPVETLREVLDIVDHVLVMSVNPGFGGQPFLPQTLHKMTKLAEIRSEHGYQFRIEVDGGVGMETVAEVVRAGAEILVAGSAVFGKGDAKQNARELLDAARSASLQRV